MRIGIWCDYGSTLEPSEGIGVFVDNLARSLVRADPECHVVLMAHVGQERVLAPTAANGLGRITVASGTKINRLRRECHRLVKKFRLRFESCKTIQWLETRIKPKTTASTVAIINGCDVWLLPFVGLDQDFDKPTVVAIHDLVFFHFPEMISKQKLRSFKETVNRVVRRASMAACMSDFIRNHDLLGVLGLPPSRVRVVNAAVPDDLVEPLTHDSQVALPIPKDAVGKYIFYPSAFRGYKNHRYLIEGLHRMKRTSDAPWKIVFTGIHETPQPILQLIDKLGLNDDVFVLTKVSREVLSGLYQNAFITMVPSLYEQGSFPAIEALCRGCPVAVSDIPAFREQFQSMADSMIFFDPSDADSLQTVVSQLSLDRLAIVERQQIGFEKLRSRSWTSVANAWLDIFHEAIETPNTIGDITQPRAAA